MVITDAKPFALTLRVSGKLRFKTLSAKDLLDVISAIHDA